MKKMFSAAMLASQGPKWNFESQCYIQKDTTESLPMADTLVFDPGRWHFDFDCFSIENLEPFPEYCFQGIFPG